MMGKPITMDQLRQDVGNMVEKITKVIAIFRQFQLKMEEYVCLKVIAMVSQDDLTHGGTNPTLNVIHEKYLGCLRSFAKKHFPNQPNRVEELLVRLPEVHSLTQHIFSSIIALLSASRFKWQPRYSWNPRCFMCHSC